MAGSHAVGSAKLANVSRWLPTVPSGTTSTRRRPTAPPDLPERPRDSELNNLPITSDHAIAAARLPPIHRDPFDRMLVAQARCERLVLVTRDATVRSYDVPLLPA